MSRRQGEKMIKKKFILLRLKNELLPRSKAPGETPSRPLNRNIISVRCDVDQIIGVIIPKNRHKIIIVRTGHARCLPHNHRLNIIARSSNGREQHCR